MKNLLLSIALLPLLFSCSKDSNPKNFSSEDYIGVYSRNEDWGDGRGFVSATYDITISYGAKDNEIILQEYVIEPIRNVTCQVNGNSISFTGGETRTFSDGEVETWSINGTGTLSSDKTKLDINYTYSFKDDSDDVTYNVISILTRK